MSAPLKWLNYLKFMCMAVLQFAAPAASTIVRWLKACGRSREPFSNCQWQEDLLLDADWRELWQQMKCWIEPDTAVRWMVEALYIAAAQGREVEVAGYGKSELAAGTLPSIVSHINSTSCIYLSQKLPRCNTNSQAMTDSSSHSPRRVRTKA